MLAPDSAVAEFISFLTLPAAFVLGYVGWLGRAILALPRLLVERATHSRSMAGRRSAGALPPGSFAFVPVSLLSAVVSGAVVAAVSTRWGVGAVLVIYAVAGLGYGLVCWRLARAGFLQFPRE